MENSLYHNVICGIKAAYPLIRDRPSKHHPNIKVFGYNISENDITELKRIFYGGKTHADCNFCEEAHDPRR